MNTLEKTKSFLSDQAQSLVHIIESSLSEEERRDAIYTLSQEKDPNVSRVLIDAWYILIWRETKISIIRALGTIADERGVEFLIRFIQESDDLPLVSEALLALGESGLQFGGEFILSCLEDAAFPLVKEALLAIGKMSGFHYEEKLLKILNNSESSPTLIQYAILALGHLSPQVGWSALKPFLNHSNPSIVNAAMLSVGRLGDVEAFKLLKEFDSRFRFFANELKIYALDHMQKRLALKIEDIISILLQNPNPKEWEQLIRLLCEFPKDQAWEGILLFGQNYDPNLLTLLRAAIYLEDRKDDDWYMINRNKGKIQWDNISILLRRLLQSDKNKFKEKFFTIFTPEEQIQILKRLKYSFAMKHIGQLAANDNLPEALRIEAINALVQQVLMEGKKISAVQAAGEILLSLLKKESLVSIQARLIRALGQIRFEGKELFQVLHEKLKDEEPLRASIYKSLPSFVTKEAAELLVRRLKNIHYKNTEETELLLESLSKIKNIPPTPLLAEISQEVREKSKLSFLKILSNNSLSGFETFILHELESEHYQNCLLAVAAARLNPSVVLMEKLLTLLYHNNKSIFGRALDSLCIAGNSEWHQKLLEWFEQNCFEDKRIAMKIFRSFTPHSTDSYKDIFHLIDKWISHKSGCLKDSEVFSAALNLRDQLALTYLIPTADKILERSHELDKHMEEQLDAYEKYSEPIKAVLRNAELTWHYPELFDDFVDKSTMVVELTKSIDLFLQETLGKAMFFDPRKKVLEEMQSRVLQCELDENFYNTEQILHALQCDSHFNLETFPFHKLSVMCQSIASGKFQRDQLKLIDGLRSWSLLILLFGRTFTYRSYKLSPIFPVNKGENQRIKDLAVQMNSLQELRNRAAHRGVLFDKNQQKSIRQESFILLNDLNKIMQ